MDKKTLEAFAREVAKGLKTEKYLAEFRQILTKVTVEAALNAELDELLGYDRHQASTNDNSRNGYASKTVKTEDGQFELETPRDRDGSFEPQLVKKGQTRFTSMDDKILSLYTKGMTTREIVATFKEMYGADVSPTLISKVTDLSRLTGQHNCRYAGQVNCRSIVEVIEFQLSLTFLCLQRHPMQYPAFLLIHSFTLVTYDNQHRHYFV